MSSRTLNRLLALLSIVVWVGSSGCLAASDPGATDPSPTDPGPTDPGATDPSPTDPGPTDPGPTDPGPTDPGPTALPPRPDRPAVCAPVVADLALPDSYAGTLRGKNVFSSMTCGWSSPGPEEHFTLSVTERTGLIARTPRRDGDIAALVGIRQACDDQSTERWCSNSSSLPATSTYIRAVLEPGHYELVVDQRDTEWPPRWGGPYALVVDSFDPAPNATCAGALPLAPGLLTDQDLAGGAMTESWDCGARSRTALFYEVTVPPRAMTEVSAIVAPGTGAVFMEGLTGCGSTLVDASCGQHDYAQAPKPLRIANTSELPMKAIVAVYAADESALPRFDLVASEHDLAPNASCATPLHVDLDATVTGHDTTLGSSLADGAACSHARALFYAVTLPPRTRAATHITSETGGGHAYGTFQRACGDDWDTCPVDPREAINATDEPLDVVLAVGASGTQTAVFDLSFSSAPVAANATCETATPLPLDTPITADSHLGGGRDHECGAYFSGRSLFWRVEVPAGEVVEVVASPNAVSPHGFGAFVSARPACDQMHACLFPNDFFSDGDSVLRLDNRDGDEPTSWIANAFVVDFGEGDPATDLTFTLTASVTDAPPTAVH